MDRKRRPGSQSPQPKRQKVVHDTVPNSPPTVESISLNKAGADLCTDNLTTGFLAEKNVEKLREEYTTSIPYKYARVEALFQDDLLKNVKDECLNHLSFTEKETDIYRVSCEQFFAILRTPLRVCVWVRFIRIPAPGGEQLDSFSLFLFFFITSGPLLYFVRDFPLIEK